MAYGAQMRGFPGAPQHFPPNQMMQMMQAYGQQPAQQSLSQPGAQGFPQMMQNAMQPGQAHMLSQPGVFPPAGAMEGRAPISSFPDQQMAHTIANLNKLAEYCAANSDYHSVHGHF